jgi:hypothetical protein
VTAPPAARSTASVDRAASTGRFTRDFAGLRVRHCALVVLREEKEKLP